MRCEGSLSREGVGWLDGAMTRLLWCAQLETPLNILLAAVPVAKPACLLHSLLWQASDCGSAGGRATPWSPCLEIPA